MRNFQEKVYGSLTHTNWMTPRDVCLDIRTDRLGEVREILDQLVEDGLVMREKRTLTHREITQKHNEGIYLPLGKDTYRWVFCKR